MSTANVLRPRANSPCRLTSISPELILAIMQLSGPADLKIIASVCRLFYNILKANPSCWTYARKNLSIPMPPVLGTIEFSSTEHPLLITPFRARGTSENALIEYIFGGGTCTVCGVWSSDIPFSFAFNWRTCSKSCFHRISNLNAKNLVRFSAAEIAQHPELKWLVYQEDKSGRSYFRNKVAEARSDIEQQLSSRSPEERAHYNSSASLVAECHMLTFKALERWKERYSKAVVETKEANLDFLKPIAAEKRCSPQNFFKSPTFLRIFRAFNRDLTCMGINDWRVIEETVGRELKWRK
ncbi:hypothetical protein B0H11DRAFT_2092621 [Mycena galericulata]|nr:hypothetical protein B0H11DRAFT_2092621 [Mycena galericulata]